MPPYLEAIEKSATVWDGTSMISADDDVVNFVKLFRPLAGLHTMEVFRLGRADVLQYMAETFSEILPKSLARTEKGAHYGGTAAYKDFLNYFYLRRMRRTPCEITTARGCLATRLSQ